MPTLSADVTSKMKEWIDEKVKSGAYKSKSEVIRELCREKMEIEKNTKSAIAVTAPEQIYHPQEEDHWRLRRVR